MNGHANTGHRRLPGHKPGPVTKGWLFWHHPHMLRERVRNSRCVVLREKTSMRCLQVANTKCSHEKPQYLPVGIRRSIMTFRVTCKCVKEGPDLDVLERMERHPTENKPKQSKSRKARKRQRPKFERTLNQTRKHGGSWEHVEEKNATIQNATTPIG